MKKARPQKVVTGSAIHHAMEIQADLVRCPAPSVSSGIVIVRVPLSLTSVVVDVSITGWLAGSDPDTRQRAISIHHLADRRSRRRAPRRDHCRFRLTVQ
ncbi:MAG: hypothetical protein IPK39_23170 [Sulfuritalea sp.]|nr:hypothetical protein [Sulfuritalea sp.]